MPRSDDPFTAVTTFTVLADMAQNVAGDAAEVVSITKPGAEIHGYEPTPQDIVRASDADLILWNGLNLELWFEQFLANLGDIPSATLTEGIEPIPIAEGAYEGEANPHAWMGADNALVYVDNIAAAFAEHDPENAETYRANAEAYKTEIRDTIGPLRDRIAQIPAEDRWLVTCEGAFSYLARDFGMRELYLWPMNADQVGTPQQVRSVIDGVRENDIPVVFCESTVNTAPGRAGRPRDGGDLRRRALRRLADGGRRPRADLPRSAARHVPDRGRRDGCGHELIDASCSTPSAAVDPAPRRPNRVRTSGPVMPRNS